MINLSSTIYGLWGIFILPLKKGEEMTLVLGEDYLDHMEKKKKKKVSSKGETLTMSVQVN